MMKVYTRTGDKGETSLVSGERVLKSSTFMDCCGEADELNSYLGLAITYLSPASSASSVSSSSPVPISKEPVPWRETLQRELQEIQNLLFCIGSHLACSTPKREKLQLPPISLHSARHLEISIDKMQAQLEPLKNFILPGGGILGAYLHFCRALSRRLERTVIRHLSSLPSLSSSDANGNQKKEKVAPEVLAYLNRLSDYFFVAARFCNKMQGKEEIKWNPKNEET